MHELRADDCREIPAHLDSLSDLVRMFSTVRVLVVGDSMVDQYHFGRVDRISPEAPVPIFIEETSEPRRGGAGNVAHQLEALGCQVRTVFAKRWSVKHRYFAGHHQVFRRDEDQFATAEDIDSACQRIAYQINECDVVVLSDYAKGLLSPSLCQDVIRYGKTTVVDPKGRDWSKYRGAQVICPNEHELLSGTQERHRGMIVAKLGAKGLAIRTHDGVEHLRIPAQAKQVFDVTGAGDVVTALVAASIAVNGSFHDAAVIANHAAGVVVGKLGTAVCTKDELLAALA
jgi:D-beta-D-heptose 7-phosphate kinase/D-beta-D-heptose 1-phosphate adenosyltransferase